MGVRLLAVAAAFQIFDGIQGISTGALRGLGKTRGPMAINMVAYGVIGLPIGISAVFPHPLGHLWIVEWLDPGAHFRRRDGGGAVAQRLQGDLNAIGTTLRVMSDNIYSVN